MKMSVRVNAVETSRSTPNAWPILDDKTTGMELHVRQCSTNTSGSMPFLKKEVISSNKTKKQFNSKCDHISSEKGR